MDRLLLKTKTCHLFLIFLLFRYSALSYNLVLDMSEKEFLTFLS